MCKPVLDWRYDAENFIWSPEGFYGLWFERCGTDCDGSTVCLVHVGEWGVLGVSLPYSTDAPMCAAVERRLARLYGSRPVNWASWHWQDYRDAVEPVMDVLNA